MDVSCLELKIPPPIWMVLHVLLEYCISTVNDTFTFSGNWRFVGAAVIGIIGVLFIGSGITLFRNAGTTPSPLEPERSSALVTSGVYQITRNPMYVGLLFLLLASGAALGDGVAIVVGPILFAVIITRLQIIPEERALRSTFGEEYVTYTQRTRRWL